MLQWWKEIVFYFWSMGVVFACGGGGGRVDRENEKEHARMWIGLAAEILPVAVFSAHNIT